MPEGIHSERTWLGRSSVLLVVYQSDPFPAEESVCHSMQKVLSRKRPLMKLWQLTDTSSILYGSNYRRHGSINRHTVDRHKFNHLATNSTTFAAFSWPLYCTLNFAMKNKNKVQGAIELPGLEFFKYL